jgi:hypothetical protein
MSGWAMPPQPSSHAPVQPKDGQPSEGTTALAYGVLVVARSPLRDQQAAAIPR